MSIRRRAALAVVALLPVPGALAEPEGIPFTPSSGGAVIVPVLVDGRGPDSFLIDTGANRSAVSKDLARELGLEAVARMSVVTPAGEEWRRVVRFALSVGAASAEGILASVVDMDRRGMDGARFDGIVGQDFLSQFDYTIDYRRRVLTWGAAPDDGRRLALRISEGRFLVDLPQAGRGAPMRFVPDSGTNGLVVFERAGGSPLSMERLPGGSELVSSSGQRRFVDMRRIRSLRIGDLEWRDQIAAVVSRPEADAPEGDGLLPLHQFASVTFGSHAGYLVIRAR